MTKTATLTGSLTWNSTERRSDRYGGIMLATETVNVNEGETADNVELSPAAPLVGKRVTITATVLESNVSCHVGDLQRGIAPSQTPVGETLDLGTGLLVEINNDDDCPSLVFCRDGRDNLNDWMDPHVLYRLHDHVVELKIVEEADQTVRPALPSQRIRDGFIMESTGDGFMQMKTTYE